MQERQTIGFPALSISSFAQDRMSRMDSKALNVLSSRTQRSWSVAQCSLELEPFPQTAHFMTGIVADGASDVLDMLRTTNGGLMKDIEQVAREPEPGDEVILINGKITYRVKEVTIAPSPTGGRSTTIRAEREESGKTQIVLLFLPAWTDLVAHAAATVRSPEMPVERLRV